MTTSDIRVKNGVIHLVDHVLSLPPRIVELISSAPEGQCSRFRQALQRTGLADELASSKFMGCTLFIPSDKAFENLGQELQDFLQSPGGTPYLRALLQYHVVLDETLYSNVFYHGVNEKGTTCPPIGHKPHTSLPTEANAAKSTPPKQPGKVLKGKRTFPLPTMLDGALIHVEVTRYAGAISMFVQEGQASVVTQDIVTLDGIVHVVDRVLLPSLQSLSPISEHDTKRSTLPALLSDVEQLKAVLGSHV